MPAKRCKWQDMSDDEYERLKATPITWGECKIGINSPTTPCPMQPRNPSHLIDKVP